MEYSSKMTKPARQKDFKIFEDMYGPGLWRRRRFFFYRNPTIITKTQDLADLDRGGVYISLMTPICNVRVRYSNIFIKRLSILLHPHVLSNYRMPIGGGAIKKRMMIWPIY